MQKKRPRSKGGSNSGSGEAPAAPAGNGRTVRVRTRLVAGVAVVGITVIAAGAPAVLAASSDLTDSQALVTLAELNQQAISLAHSLADERDEVTAYIAGGREGEPGSRSTRVDQQVDEIRETAPADLRRDLSTIPSLRRDAVSGKGTALEAHRAYSEVIAKLHGLADELARDTPPRAAEETRTPQALGRATEQAAATRGLLLAALAVPRPQQTTPRIDPFTGLPVQPQDEGETKEDRTRDALSAAAQQARVGELSALAEFDQSAGATARDKLASIVTGPEVNSAEKYLAELTDRPELSDSDLEVSSKKVAAVLSARVDRMRSVESALGTTQAQRLEQLRDDDVTALELRIALLGGCLLVAVGVSTAVARTLTQPLAVLRIGAARLAAEPATAEPVRYTGRNDEFAQVVRSINALHGQLHGLLTEFNGRFESLETERAELIAGREALTGQRAELQARVADLTAQLEKLKNTVHHTFVNLSLRTLGLVERQLGVIETLEEREQDPERLGTLFKLDHMATVMRRHSENMLVLAGAEHGHGHPGPIPLVDVLRAAVSEIERYERVTIQSLPPHAQVAGFAADDLSHLVAELLENATSFSPPDSHVQLSGWLLETGEVMLSVQDEGIGMSSVRMGELNTRLADPTLFEAGEQNADGAGLGLQVTSLLAARHGVRVELREQKGSGVTAVVVLPEALLPKALPAATPPPVTTHGEESTLNLPGSVAEANSNALPGRGPSTSDDPMIAAAERVIAASGTAEVMETSGATETAEVTETTEVTGTAGATGTAGFTQATETTEVTATAGATATAEFTQATETSGATDAPADAAAPEAPQAPETPETSHVPQASDTAAEPAPGTAPEPAPGTTPEPAPGTTPEPAPGTTPEPAAEPTPEPGRETAPAAETDPEATLQVRLPRPPRTDDVPEPTTAGGPYAIGPDRHERAADEGPHSAPAPAASAVPETPEAAEPVADAVPGPRKPEAGRVTDKGLPKRTPKIVRPAGAPAAERRGSVDKEALRRRLGGFHQGAKDGRRDVEAEIAEGTGPALGTTRTEHAEPAGRSDGRTGETGDTVEEARS
ncbi:HAMP domain-containing protein [Streptomyces sp. A0958]|uniref:nitrate- and nitrite sensing domain-containing protein n=1 Tax=Streptomyces sp. A0958 TaxID=2563101 RepID=UPI00109EC7ED|nr:nitrate- and nitrite sensing domain-containing protein [Streptomyces sp. A0958]THA70354.1 HAMP domain-containing protein [Streptomyces sp. A0958]